LEVLGGDRLDPDVGILNERLGRALGFAGDHDRAAPALESALWIAQALTLPELLSRALTTKATMCLDTGRVEEAGYLYAAAIDVAERHQLTNALDVAHLNLGNLAMQWDRPDATAQCQAALTFARRGGNRRSESTAAGNLMAVQLDTGRWEQLERLAHELLENHENRPGAPHVHARLTVLHALRGQLEPARASLEQVSAWRDSDDAEGHGFHAALRIIVQFAEGELQAALTLGLETLPTTVATLGAAHEVIRFAWPHALDAALELGRLQDTRRLLALLDEQPPGHIPPFLRAHLARGRGLLAAVTGEDTSVQTELTTAIEGFHALGYSYWHALTQIDLAAWLTEQGHGSDATPLLTEAIPTLQALAAAPALARASQIAGTSASTIPA
jgi:tetratricopeptide (TPR) repeat protein